MGKYINLIKGEHIGITAHEKCESLLKEGAKEIKEPKEFQDNLICVVDNGFFGAAGYAYSKEEMNEFKRFDGRPKRWFILENVQEHID